MEQTLEEFVAEMRADLDKFEKSWRENNAVSPESYPMKLLSGDWLEQFTLFDGVSV